MTERSWIIANGMDLDATVVSSSPTWHTVLDIVGDLLTNRCQVEELLFYRRVFCRFGKLPKLCRFVPKIIGPIHATRTMFEGSDGQQRAPEAFPGVVQCLIINRPNSSKFGELGLIQ
jgi:hypothetical protein